MPVSLEAKTRSATIIAAAETNPSQGQRLRGKSESRHLPSHLPHPGLPQPLSTSFVPWEREPLQSGLC